MSISRPFLLLGELQLSRIRDAHLSAWRNWTDCWIPASNGEVDCTCSTPSTGLIQNERIHWYHAPKWPLDCRIGLDPETSGAWIAKTLPRHRENFDHIHSVTTFRLLQKLLDQLVASIARQTNDVPDTPCNPGQWLECSPDEGWLAYASGTAYVEFQSSMGAVSFLLSPQAARLLAFPDPTNASAQQQPTLVRRSQSLDFTEIALEVSTKSLYPLTLGDVARLTIGDVMLLDNLIDDPWSVFIEGNDERIASGTLGKRNGKLALRITLNDTH